MASVDTTSTAAPNPSRRDDDPIATAARVHACNVVFNEFCTAPGMTWTAAALPDAPGWHSVWQVGADGTRPNDGRIFIGPEDRIVVVSSDPLKHGIEETVAVLAEPASHKRDPLDIARDIQRRTEQRPAIQATA